MNIFFSQWHWYIKRATRIVHIKCIKVNKVHVRSFAISSVVAGAWKSPHEDNVYRALSSCRDIYIYIRIVLSSSSAASRASPQMTHAKVNYTLKGFNIMKCSICMSSLCSTLRVRSLSLYISLSLSLSLVSRFPEA